MCKGCFVIACTKAEGFRSARQQQSTSILYTKAFQIWEDKLMVKQEQATWKPS